MIKLICTDLDGTLLKDDHEVPDRFWGIADRLFSKGIKLSIATGRSHVSITEKFQSIVDHLYAISDNGSLIIHDKTELLAKPLPPHEIEALVKAGRPVNQAWPILCGKNQWFLESDDKVLIETVARYHNNFVIVDDLTKVTADILKVTVLDLAGSEQNSYLQYKQFAGKLKIAIGGAMWLDITRADVNKGLAVQVLQQSYGITPDETLVFGDFMNDYEMMQTATYSYAMKNANPKLKEVANYVTEKDNNAGGILDVIETLCLNA